MIKEKVLGFDVCTENQEKMLQDIFNDFEQNKKLFIVNINPEIAVNNYQNEELKKSLITRNIKFQMEQELYGHLKKIMETSNKELRE